MVGTLIELFVKPNWISEASMRKHPCKIENVKREITIKNLVGMN